MAVLKAFLMDFLDIICSLYWPNLVTVRDDRLGFGRTILEIQPGFTLFHTNMNNEAKS